MAKKKMLCPFSGELCRECPQYRGRHYYLCFSTKYRGYLGHGKGSGAVDDWDSDPEKELQKPPKIDTRSSWLVFSDILERKDK
ncbi:MAG: hypothetical protein JXB23_15935 [Candidatus Aminicenantes bacterium]|nr:hypothetical protein [Candidatus Aminicenantes bacterium]